MPRKESKRCQLLASCGLFLVVVLVVSSETAAQTSANEVEKALTFLQQIDPKKVAKADEESVAKQINTAWKTIHDAGPKGKARLKEEIARADQSDYFKLNGAALLWTVGGLDEAETIASVWRTTSLEVQSNYVFYPAFDAARKQDEKALPMLLALLGNDKFKIHVALHAMQVAWPRTMHFIWGAYGPKRLPVLLEVLRKSQNPVEVQSTIFLFAYDQYLDALPRIRELARTADIKTRRAAIYTLGFYGHPQDYDFLIAGLRSDDADDRFHFAMALYEYEDLRAVPQLAELLSDAQPKNRREAFAALTHLLTAQSIDALVKYSQHNQGQEKEEIEDYLNSELKEYGLTLSNYLKKSPQEKAQTVESIRRKREAQRFLLRRGEKGFTRAEFLQAAETWKKNHRMQMPTSRLPVEARQILTAATVDDIKLLLEVKAAVLARLSDECLYEAERIDAVVRRLGRSRYRKDVGITDKVESR